MDNETKPRSYKVASSLILVFVLSPLVLMFQNCGGAPAESNYDLSSSSSTNTLAIYMPPQNTIGYMGGGATFSVGVNKSNSTGVVTYQWKRNGVPIPGKTSQVLVLSNLQSSDAAQYSVTVTQDGDYMFAGGTVDSSAGTLTVQSVPSTAVAPTIVSQSSSTMMNSGSSYFHRVQVDGFPRPNIQWYKDGTAISVTGENLPIPYVGSGYNGVYYAVISNIAGSVTSQPVMIGVDQSSIAPVIVDSSESGTVAVGETVELFALAAGLESPSYQWYKGNTPIAGATQSTYKITNVQKSHAGTYSFVATNSAGTASVSGDLTVE